MALFDFPNVLRVVVVIHVVDFVSHILSNKVLENAAPLDVRLRLVIADRIDIESNFNYHSELDQVPENLKIWLF